MQSQKIVQSTWIFSLAFSMLKNIVITYLCPPCARWREGIAVHDAMESGQAAGYNEPPFIFKLGLTMANGRTYIYHSIF